MLTARGSSDAVHLRPWKYVENEKYEIGMGGLWSPKSC